MIIFKKIFFLILFICLFSFSVLYSKEIRFEGLRSLSSDDLKIISGYEKINFLNEKQLNELIKKLFQSDLIQDVSYLDKDDFYLVNIKESDLIYEIYINGNKILDDETILLNIKSRVSSFKNDKIILNDISKIKELYKSLGYLNVDITTKSEKFSENKINLIFQISETKKSIISEVNFFGNKSISSRLIRGKLLTEEKNPYNFFSSGSNFNEDVIKFDINSIIDLYNDEGFNDIEVSYSIEQINSEKFQLNFYIIENYRSKVISSDYLFDDNFLNSKEFRKIKSKYEKNLKSNNSFYKFEILSKFIKEIDDLLLVKNIYNKQADIKVSDDNNDFRIIYSFKELLPQKIGKIDIIGNDITKSSTLRSKLLISPGDYYNQNKIDQTITSMSQLKYINNIDIKKIDNNENPSLIVEIDENKKTGNLLLAGTFNGDTGIGAAIGINDSNILGTGNEVSANFNVNVEKAIFDMSYKQYAYNNPNLSNFYRIYSLENDFKDSYGYKSNSKGFVYGLQYKINDYVDSNISIKLSTTKGFSPLNSSDTSISDNIGNFDDLTLSYSINRDTTNDLFYPNDGSYNDLSINYQPENISDNSLIKLIYSNRIFFKNSQNENFIFTTNKIGFAESLNGNLKTNDAFSLGGLSFKGFDYKGIGPLSENNIYLGGNKFFTSTFGYGSSFIFDKKDNINIKFYGTIGSLWDSDYSTNNDFKLRSSVGISFDFMTGFAPISLSYAVPIQTVDGDKSNTFNFSIGTSF